MIIYHNTVLSGVVVRKTQQQLTAFDFLPASVNTVRQAGAQADTVWVFTQPLNVGAISLQAVLVGNACSRLPS